jgi:hypothetical protein
LVAKFGVELGGWHTKNVRRGAWLWSLEGMMSGWEVYSQHVEFVVELGGRIWFWQNKWCGDLSLRDRFLVLFACSSYRDATIESLLVRSSPWGVREWNITFIRAFNDWKV